VSGMVTRCSATAAMRRSCSSLRNRKGFPWRWKGEPFVPKAPLVASRRISSAQCLYERLDGGSAGGQRAAGAGRKVFRLP
jgi:hypothetical protein